MADEVLAPQVPASQPTVKSTETVPVVPPSTAEVSIRTMQSDVELMGKSGGMPAAQVSRVAVAPDNVQTGPLGVAVPGQTPMPTMEKPEARWIKPLIWAAVILAGAAILLVIGYYVSPLLLKK